MKNIFLILIIIISVSCKKDEPPVQDNTSTDPDFVQSIEVFSTIGGRVDWNATTNLIAFDQEYDGRWDLFISDENQTNVVNLTASMNNQTFGDQTVQSWQHRGQPAFHPSGDYILFQVMNEHASTTPETEELLSLGVNNDLWIMKSDGTNYQKLTNNPADYAVLHPHFSYDGTKICWSERYTANTTGSIFGGWRMKIADIAIDASGNATLSNITNIQPGGERWYETHSFSIDGSKIYFSGNLTTDHKANDIYSYDLTSSQLQNITNSPSNWEEMYNLNPTNPNSYSFISSRFFDWNNNFGWATLRTELYVNDGSTVHQVTFYNQEGVPNSPNLSSAQYFIGDHCWSPDGKTILAVLAEATFGNTNSKILKIKLN